MTLALIDEAVSSGARLEKACDVLGLSGRTEVPPVSWTG
jgi:hypothetical protein